MTARIVWLSTVVPDDARQPDSWRAITNSSVVGQFNSIAKEVVAQIPRIEWFDAGHVSAARDHDDQLANGGTHLQGAYYNTLADILLRSL